LLKKPNNGGIPIAENNIIQKKKVKNLSELYKNNNSLISLKFVFVLLFLKFNIKLHKANDIKL